MEQRIDLEQFNQLSEKGKERLREWWKPQVGDWYTHGDDDMLLDHRSDINKENKCSFGSAKRGVYPLLSLGQMIEFLWKRKSMDNFHSLDGCYGAIDPNGWHVIIRGEGTIEELELCNALWEAVKEVCEK